MGGYDEELESILNELHEKIINVLKAKKKNLSWQESYEIKSTLHRYCFEVHTTMTHEDVLDVFIPLVCDIVSMIMITVNHKVMPLDDSDSAIDDILRYITDEVKQHGLGYRLGTTGKIMMRENQGRLKD